MVIALLNLNAPLYLISTVIFDWLLRRRYDDMPHFLCYLPTVPTVFLPNSSDALTPEPALITALVEMVSHHKCKKTAAQNQIK